MNVQKNSEKGFTIIEVVLVLAIAGLIFLMVFIALPALQRNQRDTARKNDVSSVASAITSFTSNSRGAAAPNGTTTLPLPAGTTTGIATYLKDVSENTTSVTIRDFNASAAVNDGVIIVTKRSKCSTNTAGTTTLAAGTTRQFTVITRLEAGNAIFCQDS